MDRSESIVKIAGALGKAQKLIGGAVKGSDNPFFKSKYASLNAVMEACKDHLNENGITVLQPIVSDANGEYVETVLVHDSGEWVSSKMKLVVGKANMQEYGSATSYARRYSLQSLVFIPSEDDDGESAMGRGKAPVKQSPVLVSDKPVTITVPSTRISAVTLSTGPTVVEQLEAADSPPFVAPRGEITSVSVPKKSSFRKPKTETPVVTTTGDEWT